MKNSALIWITTTAMLATGGAAWADSEPGAVTNYKGKVATQINIWAANLDQDETRMGKIGAEWHAVVNAKSKAMEARRHVETEKQTLELAKTAAEKKLSDLQKAPAKTPGGAAKGADAAQIKQTMDEIKKKTDEIGKKAAELNKALSDEKKADDELGAKKKELVAVEKSIEIHNATAAAIGGIEPPSGPAVFDRDTQTKAYRTEWGPNLAQWMTKELNDKKSKWSSFGATVSVDWAQSALEKKLGPVVKVSLKMPDPDAKAISLHMR